jgi:hypothetical protein
MRSSGAEPPPESAAIALGGGIALAAVEGRFCFAAVAGAEPSTKPCPRSDGGRVAISACNGDVPVARSPADQPVPTRQRSLARRSRGRRIDRPIGEVLDQVRQASEPTQIGASSRGPRTPSRQPSDSRHSAGWRLVCEKAITP